MNTKELYIKGMVCSRCIKVLQNKLEENGVTVQDICLGRIVIQYASGDINKHQIYKIIRDNEFDVIRDPSTLLAEKTRRQVTEFVRNPDRKINLSRFLYRKLNRNYDQISKNFSDVYGRTLERYYLILKIERAKELIENGDHNFSEIAWQIGYQHPSALSRQFKKETGMTLREYQQLEKRDRIPLDRI